MEGQMPTALNSDSKVPTGALLKIRLSSHGYSFVAKGMRTYNAKQLRHEEHTYRELISLQGKHVPVSLGMVKLDRDYHSSVGMLSYLLLLSWGGIPLSAKTNEPYQNHFPGMGEVALSSVHSLGILHGDAEPRNMLFDPETQKLMFIHFERSGSFMPGALSQLGSKTLRPTNGTKEKATPESRVACEMLCLRHAMQHCSREPPTSLKPGSIAMPYKLPVAEPVPRKVHGL